MKNFRSDYELVYLINEQDDLALEELIQKYKGLMISYGYRFKELFKEEFDRHELFQITLLSLYQAVLTYDEQHQCSFVTYLKVIMKRDILLYARSLQRAKKKANMNTISLDESIKEEDGLYLVDLIENNQPSFNPVDYFWAKEEKEKLLALMHKESEEDEQVMLMWMEGYTYQEIGEKLHLRNKQVEYKLRKIRKKLKGLIDYEESL